MSAFIATFMLAKRADDIINRVQGAFALIQIAHQVNCFLTLLAGSDNKPLLNFALHRELLSRELLRVEGRFRTNFGLKANLAKPAQVRPEPISSLVQGPNPDRIHEFRPLEVATEK